MTKTYQLTVTEEQAKTIQVACELLSRIQGGQVLEVFEHLPLRKDIDWGVYHEVKDELTKRMPEILKDGINGWNSHFGVGHPDLPKSHDIAWDLYQVIRYELSTEDAIERGFIQNKGERKFPEMMGCCYDKPMRYSNQPLSKFERLT